MTDNRIAFREIEPIGKLNAKVTVPGSKSITNRALVCSALADGTSRLQNVLESDDTRVMVDGLKALGFEIDWNRKDRTILITGKAGTIPSKLAEINVLGSGTTMRFLSSVCCLGKGKYTLDGIERMRQRPIGDLVRCLNQLGSETSAEKANQFPPVVVRANGLQGGNCTIAGDRSSQFLSSLLMAAPAAQKKVEISVEGELVSKPFIKLTLTVMKAFGATVDSNTQLTRFLVAPQTYQATEYFIEPDATAASYFWGAAAVCGGSVSVAGLGRKSTQGDMRFLEVLKSMGCQTVESTDALTVIGPAKHGVDVDMNGFSDTVQTVAAISLFVDGPTTIRGVAHNRLKESDRIGDLAR